MNKKLIRKMQTAAGGSLQLAPKELKREYTIIGSLIP